MAKKTFEVAIKLSISTTALQEAFMYSTSYGKRDDKALKKLNKDYDWDSILNSRKFNTHVTANIKDGQIDGDDICCDYLYKHDEEYDKIRHVYDQILIANEKKEPKTTKELKVVVSGTKNDIDSTITDIQRMGGVESVQD